MQPMRTGRRITLAWTISTVATARAFSLPAAVPSLPISIDAYSAALTAHPLETKVATAAVLAVAGDAIAQRATKQPYDRARAVSFVLFDAAYRGGFQHAAFPFIIDTCRGDVLEAAATSLSLSGPFVDQSLLAAVECTAFNQLLVVPVVYYPLFFSITGAVQGLSPTASLARARANFVDLTLRNWKFWIPAQFIQFAYLPIDWQVPYTCGMGLVWNVILSAAAGSAKVEISDEANEVGAVVPVKDGSKTSDGAGRGAVAARKTMRSDA